MQSVERPVFQAGSSPAFPATSENQFVVKFLFGDTVVPDLVSNMSLNEAEPLIRKLRGKIGTAMRDNDPCDRRMLASPSDPRLVEQTRKTFSANLRFKPGSPEHRGLFCWIISINDYAGDSLRNVALEQGKDPIFRRTQELTPLRLGPFRFSGQGRSKHERVSRQRVQADLFEDLPVVLVEFSDRIFRHGANIIAIFRGRLIGRTAGSEPVDGGSNPSPEANHQSVPQRLYGLALGASIRRFESCRSDHFSPR